MSVRMVPCALCQADIPEGLPIGVRLEGGKTLGWLRLVLPNGAVLHECGRRP